MNKVDRNPVHKNIFFFHSDRAVSTFNDDGSETRVYPELMRSSMLLENPKHERHANPNAELGECYTDDEIDLLRELLRKGWDFLARKAESDE